MRTREIIMTNDNNDKNSNQPIPIHDLQATSKQKKEMIEEITKSILKDSIKTIRDFGKFMVSLSFSAIPVYLGLLSFAKPSEEKISVSLILTILPILIYLVSAIGFILTAIPVFRKFNVENPIDSQEKINAVISKRKWIMIPSGIIFIGNIIFSSSIIISIMRHI